MERLDSARRRRPRRSWTRPPEVYLLLAAAFALAVAALLAFGPH